MWRIAREDQFSLETLIEFPVRQTYRAYLVEIFQLVVIFLHHATFLREDRGCTPMLPNINVASVSERLQSTLVVDSKEGQIQETVISHLTPASIGDCWKQPNRRFLLLRRHHLAKLIILVNTSTSIKIRASHSWLMQLYCLRWLIKWVTSLKLKILIQWVRWMKHYWGWIHLLDPFRFFLRDAGHDNLRYVNLARS